MRTSRLSLPSWSTARLKRSVISPSRPSCTCRQADQAPMTRIAPPRACSSVVRTSFCAATASAVVAKALRGASTAGSSATTRASSARPATAASTTPSQKSRPRLRFMTQIVALSRSPGNTSADRRPRQIRPSAGRQRPGGRRRRPATVPSAASWRSTLPTGSRWARWTCGPPRTTGNCRCGTASAPNARGCAAHERRPSHRLSAGGAAHQLPGHLPPCAGVVERQRGRPGRLPGHPLVDRPPGPLRLVGGLRCRRGSAGRRGGDLRGDRRRPGRPAAPAPPPLVAARPWLWDRVADHLAHVGVRLPGPSRPAGRGHGGGAIGARGERLAAGAEWSPYSQRQALVREVHAARQVVRATRRHHEPTNPALAPALGIAYPGGDLYPWLRQRGRSIEVVIPEREQRLAMAVLGIPGSGKTYTLLRRVWIAARAGMRVIFVDCKGTDPGLAWQVTCAYRLANPGAVVGFWPTQPLDCWRGDGMAIANRLLAVEDWAAEGGGVYYRRLATLAIQLACTPPSGPPRNSGQFLRRLDLKKLQQLWRGDPTAQADLEQLAADPTVLAGVRGRYSAFFRALQDTADGCWGLEDVDLAVLTIPTIASRQDADAAVRLVLEDLGHFATRRKARVGDDVLLVLDEFSAVQGGTDQAIHLAERLRDVGVPVIFGAQSPEGLGDERQQWRLLHTVGGGLVLHQTPNPEALVDLAGTVRTPEQAWQLDPWGPAGEARVHMADRPRVDPNQVRQLHPGEAFLIQAGRAVKLSVLQAPVPAQVQEEASALRAAAMDAAEPVFVAESIVGAPPQVELWQPSRQALDQPDQVPLLALAAPSVDGQT